MSVSCKGCNNPLFKTSPRKQYERLACRGLTEDGIKDLLPRCQKCVTVLLKARRMESSDGQAIHL
jgi:hypothetical protein